MSELPFLDAQNNGVLSLLSAELTSVSVHWIMDSTLARSPDFAASRRSKLKFAIFEHAVSVLGMAVVDCWLVNSAALVIDVLSKSNIIDLSKNSHQT